MTSDVVGCLACDLTGGRRPLPGGELFASGGWRIEHCVGPLGVGTLIVKPLRHVVHVADLTAEESAALGPLLRRAAGAVTAVVRPEQVYVCLWSHADRVPGHLHFVVQPAMRADLDRYGAHGPRLQMAMFDAGVTPDEAEAAAMADRLRPALAAAD
jgi:diadenosine tetraphosphate (Ap4A) HIT family hydrolase